MASPNDCSPEQQLARARPVSDPVRRGPALDRRRACLEIVVVLGAFIGWILINSLAPIIDLLAAALAIPALYLEVFCTGAVILLALGGIRLIGKPPAAGLGLSRTKILRELCVGLAAVLPAYGIAISASLVSAGVWSLFDPEAAQAMTTGKQPLLQGIATISPAMVIPIMAFVGFYEELLFRGFLLGRLMVITRRAVWPIILSSVVFGLLHHSAQGWIGVIQTTSLGIALAALTVWRRSIWPAIACHVTINAAVTFVVLALYPQIQELLQMMSEPSGAAGP